MGFFDLFKKSRPTPASAPSAPPEPAATAQTPRAVDEVLDHLALLHGHSEVEILAHVDELRLGIDSVTVQPPVTDRLEFPDDPAIRTAFLAQALHRLWASLGMRSDGFSSFNAFADDRSIQLMGQTFSGSGHRLHDAAFFRALAPALRGGQRGFAEWQEDFRVRFATMSEGRLSWDRAAGQFALDDAAGVTTRVEAHVLGSFSPDELTWCWAWANRALANADRAAISRVRDTSELRVLRDEGFACTEPWSFAVAALAAHAIDPSLHIWRWPQRAHLFFAVRLP